jgi:hypothetical protein
MKVKLSFIAALVAAIATGLTVAPLATPANPNKGSGGGGAALTVPISGTSSTQSFVGSFTLQSFRVVNDTLVATGQLVGTATNLVSGAVTQINQTVNIPVTSINGSCQILHLELGPLDLNLLGLMIHLDKVVLDITAQSGPGNLLGNLLCGLAGLLDQSTPLTQLANTLNQILALLR